MTHDRIEQQETIDRYVSGRLATEERRAFEEHFFACDECFERVQMTERLAAGVRDAAKSGQLERPSEGETRWRFLWWRPAAVLAGGAALALGAVLVWLVWQRLPELRRELAAERQTRSEELQRAQAELKRAEESRAEREKRLAERLPANGQMAGNEQLASNRAPEPNVPFVALEAVRDAGAVNQIAVPASARSLLLWIEVEPDSRFSRFRLQIHGAGDRLLTTIDGLRPNRQGALAASLPAASLAPGNYLIRLYGVGQQQPELSGEYRLHVSR